MSILVVAAHPDDEVLGCGGVLALNGGKDPVDILILGEGITSRSERREHANTAAVERLRADAQAAGKMLGARSVRLANFPDNRFDGVPLLDVIKVVEAAVAELSPQTIYTHHPGDLNVDHGVTFRAVMTATRPMADQAVRDVYSFEVSSSTEWAFQQIQPPFRPNVFVDVSSSIERKVKAMLQYESEVRPFPHPRSGEAIRVQARRWGSVAGCEYAEAFELIRSVRR
jgi:LmbE family N-acetylglucosaminyl deacetylase